MDRHLANDFMMSRAKIEALFIEKKNNNNNNRKSIAGAG